MSKYLFVLFLALPLFLLGCSSLNSDAEEAADLVAKSLKYTREGDIEEAESLYKEYLEIERKYKGTDDYKAFKEAYNKYYADIFGIEDKK